MTLLRNLLFQVCIALLFLSFCSYCQRFDVPDDCFRDDNDEIVDQLEIGASMLEMPPFSTFSQISGVLRTSARAVDSDDDTRNCLQSIFLRIDEYFSRLHDRLHRMQATIEMNAGLREMREAFENVYAVYGKLKAWREFKEEVTEREMKNACEHRDPKASLEKFKRSLITPPKLLDALMIGVKYSQKAFENLTKDIFEQTALCATVAVTCSDILYQNASEKFQSWHKREINGSLEIITEIYRSMHTEFEQKFVDEVPRDINTALEVAAERRYKGKETALFIQASLSDKYKFRSWAVLIYSRTQVTSVATIPEASKNKKWFLASNSAYNVIVHGAEKTMDCSSYEESFRDKTLMRLLDYNHDIYGKIADENEVVTHSAARVESALRHQLPHDHFIVVIRYTSSLKLARNPDKKYNFYEQVKHPKSNTVTKGVFIGWC